MDLHYRAASVEDAPYCGRLDLNAREEGWLWGDTAAEHREQIDVGVLDYVIAEEHRSRRVGYALLAGYRPNADIVEMRRIVVGQPNRGIGRTFMTALINRAFDEFGAHRMWLDTFEHNQRGQYLYESLGFTGEGVLRSGFRLGERFVSLFVYGLLREEWQALRQQSTEGQRS